MGNVEPRATPAGTTRSHDVAAVGYLRLATPCATSEEFATRFARFVDETSIFVVTRSVVHVGLERPFVFQLADGSIVFEGRARVVGISTGKEPDARRRGMTLRVLELSDPSRALHRRMLELRAAPPPAPVVAPPPLPRRPGTPLPRLSTVGILPLPAPRPERLATGTPVPVRVEERTPGSPFVLPANPFGELSEDVLRSFIECVLYEDFATPREDRAVEPATFEAPVCLPAQAASPAPAPVPVPVRAEPVVAPRLASVPDGDVATDDELALAIGGRGMRGTLVAIAAVGLLGLIVGYLLGGRRPDAAPSPAPTHPVRTSAGSPSVAAPGAMPGAMPAPTGAPSPAVAAVVDPGASASAVVAGAGCRARVVVSAADVAVDWNGSPLGTTPLDEVAVPCGPATVVLTHPRYQRVERQVEAEPGGVTAIAVELQRPSGQLTLTSRPPGAMFSIDGVAVGTGRRTIKVRAFTYVEVSAALPGYKRWSSRVYLRGATTTALAALIPAARARAPRSASAP